MYTIWFLLVRLRGNGYVTQNTSLNHMKYYVLFYIAGYERID